METKEILAVLREMKADFESEIILEKCKGGFCRWLIKRKLTEEIPCFIIELEKDYLHRYFPVYWYFKYEMTLNKKLSIQPRIDHLNRTISRLENEIKNEKL